MSDKERQHAQDNMFKEIATIVSDKCKKKVIEFSKFLKFGLI